MSNTHSHAKFSDLIGLSLVDFASRLADTGLTHEQIKFEIRDEPGFEPGQVCDVTRSDTKVIVTISHRPWLNFIHDSLERELSDTERYGLILAQLHGVLSRQLIRACGLPAFIEEQQNIQLANSLPTPTQPQYRSAESLQRWLCEHWGLENVEITTRVLRTPESLQAIEDLTLGESSLAPVQPKLMLQITGNPPQNCDVEVLESVLEQDLEQQFELEVEVKLNISAH